jgi:cell division protein FtsW
VRRFLDCFDNPAALLAIVVAAMISLGTVMLYSASGARAGLESIRAQARVESRADEDYRFHHSASYVWRQGIWVLAGVVLCLAMVRVPVDQLEKWSPYIYGATMLSMLAVLSPLGVEALGARRWLRAGPLTIQPSEFARIGLVLCMASLLTTRREKINDFKRGFLPTAAAFVAFAALLMPQRDLGTAFVMGLVVLCMWALANLHARYFLILFAAGTLGIVALIFKYSYRLKRILAWLDPDKYADTYAYQLNQSLIAVGSGGWWGSGIGMGLQKYHFLSESHTDFIFAIVCEELGFAGASAVVLLFLAFVVIGLRIAYQAPDYYLGLLAAGLTLAIGCSAFFSFSVVLGIAPTKGLALPFISYGGSSMVSNLMAVGLLIAISNYTMHIRGSKEWC